MAEAPVLPSAPAWLNAFGSPSLLGWLEQHQCSLALTTYQTGKLFLIGRKSAVSGSAATGGSNQALSVFERTYNYCMGMCASADGRTIWLSSRYQIWRLEQAVADAVPYRSEHNDGAGDLKSSETPNWMGRGFDVAYIPRVAYTTGHIDVHDVALDADGQIVFVNTLFNCLATLSERANFKPLWRPPFISALVPEDRCHLNGLAMRDGEPAFVTVVAQSDVADGWRERRKEGGCVLDVASGDVVCAGLSMPHSPRWYRNRLWVLNSGTGEFGTVDLDRGRFEPITFCPGYLRGLTFHGDYAIATLSKPRSDSFQGLELQERLSQAGIEPQCGLQIIDLRTGSVCDWLKLEGNLVTELYDAAVLPGVRQPMAVGFKTNEIERLISIEE